MTTDCTDARGPKVNQGVYVAYLGSAAIVAGVIGFAASASLSLAAGSHPLSGRHGRTFPLFGGAILLSVLPTFAQVERLRRRGDDEVGMRLRLVRNVVIRHLAIVWTFFGISGSAFYLQHIHRIGLSAAFGVLILSSLLLLLTSIVLGRRLRSLTHSSR